MSNRKKAALLVQAWYGDEELEIDFLEAVPKYDVCSG